MPEPVVTELYRYPVKSTRAEALRTAEFDDRGVSGDRRWMIVDEEGTFVSQRCHPILARVTSRLLDDGVCLSLEGGSSVAVAPSASGRPLHVRIWDDVVEARSEPAADAWLARVLGQRAHLVHMPAQSRRPVDPQYASEGHVVSFADGYPVLVIGSASLADLNERLPTPITMQRFRPNLVVDTSEPFEEDTWRHVRVGTAELELVKPCARCQVVTLDPRTGAGGKEPLRTLATYRRRGTKVLFGQNAIVRRPGRVCLGDRVVLVTD